MDIIAPKAQSYAERYSSPADPLLEEILVQTMATHPEHHMLSGHLQGKFLEIFSVLLKPMNVLEIGTFVGYSAICLAKGLHKEGELHTIEINEDIAAIAKTNFSRTNESDKIILHVGNALKIIPAIEKQWDLVFIDADKPNYISYYELVLPRLRTGGVILADNVLFHGQVLEEPVAGKNAKAIQSFNEYVQQDKSVEKLMLTIRDGLLMIRKK
ncbi:MAG: O-methyltransferase [Chitinophagaceae bacterium]|nr:O-methyltransferase [Chitinophagaceae bacterium]